MGARKAVRSSRLSQPQIWSKPKLGWNYSLSHELNDGQDRTMAGRYEQNICPLTDESLAALL